MASSTFKLQTFRGAPLAVLSQIGPFVQKNRIPPGFIRGIEVIELPNPNPAAHIIEVHLKYLVPRPARIDKDSVPAQVRHLFCPTTAAGLKSNTLFATPEAFDERVNTHYADIAAGGMLVWHEVFSIGHDPHTGQTLHRLWIGFLGSSS